MAQEMREAAGSTPEDQQLAAEMADAFIQDVLPENIFSSPKAGAGMWASQLRILDVGAGATLQKIPMQQNEGIQALCLARWTPRGEPATTYLVAGGSIDLVLSPRTCCQGFLDVYKVRINNICSKK